MHMCIKLLQHATTLLPEGRQTLMHLHQTAPEQWRYGSPLQSDSAAAADPAQHCSPPEQWLHNTPPPTRMRSCSCSRSAQHLHKTAPHRSSGSEKVHSKADPDAPAQHCSRAAAWQPATLTCRCNKGFTYKQTARH
jgi:hypothetical protein